MEGERERRAGKTVFLLLLFCLWLPMIESLQSPSASHGHKNLTKVATVIVLILPIKKLGVRDVNTAITSIVRFRDGNTAGSDGIRIQISAIEFKSPRSEPLSYNRSILSSPVECRPQFNSTNSHCTPTYLQSLQDLDLGPVDTEIHPYFTIFNIYF